MCLIITGTARKIRTTLMYTPGLAKDIYDSNADGIGAMYVSTKRGLRTPRCVPKDFEMFMGFIKQLPDDDRQLAVHARFATHGDTDIANCHPYDVVPGKIAMMHNGVLLHGNDADVTKSDTWHYIHNYVAPQLSTYPDLFMLPAWQDMVGNDIDDNRFVFMDEAGRLAIIHKENGIEYEDMWFSNTYAWDPTLLIPWYTPPIKHKIWPVSMFGSDAGAQTGADLSVQWEDEVWDMLCDNDVQELEAALQTRPYSTLHALLSGHEFVSVVSLDTLSDFDQEAVLLWERGSTHEIAQHIAAHPMDAKLMAEAACWYGDWLVLQGVRQPVAA